MPLAALPAVGDARLAARNGTAVDPDYAWGIAPVAVAGVFWSLGGLRFA
jgi:hypothetical protein